MPCYNCNSQFTIFKRKRSCVSCHCFYCTNCLGKRRKNICYRCEIIHNSSKRELMELKTKDLIFFLQSRKINIAGIVEKEELCNLIINHINTTSYYEAAAAANTNTTNSSASSTPNNDFENYAHSFDQIKQTCQNLFTSITDKISSDLQKTTCFNQSAQQDRKDQPVTTQQPRPRQSNPQSPSFTSIVPPPTQQSPGTSSSSNQVPSTSDFYEFKSVKKSSHDHRDCDCENSDDDLIEISEKRQSIFDAGASGSTTAANYQSSAKKTKLSTSSSIESSFEEVAGKQSDDDWQFIEKTSSSNEKQSGELQVADESNRNSNSSPSQPNTSDMCQSSFLPNSSPINPEVRKLTRRRSDSSLLNIKKSSSITIDLSSLNQSEIDSNDVKKIKISCRKCGKAKSKIKDEIMKLSEQLKSSNRSEDEINAKIKEFMDYLESKSQQSEMTETEQSQPVNANASNVPSSSSHDEIEENIFDENEGINVYASTENEPSSLQPSCSTSAPRRFISLGDIRSGEELEHMTVKQLKEVLMLNRVDFKGCCEKKELKERVKRLWEDYKSAPPSDRLSSDDLCKICMDAPIECVFLECGHTATCTACGKVLSECPICRSYIVRVVRIFKS